MRGGFELVRAREVNGPVRACREEERPDACPEQHFSNPLESLAQHF